GLSLSIVGSVLCALSSPLRSFALFVVARFIQALGSCVGLKVSYTMLADVHDQVTIARDISRLVLAFAVMPGIAVAIGGWLTELINWESCFYFLVLYALLLIYLTSRLPETAKATHLHALRLRSIYEAYGKKLANLPLVLCAAIWGCGTAVIYIFASK